MTKYKRFWEIDFARGVAIIAMIAFHIAFDLQYFDIIDIEISNFVWILFRDSIFSLFFLLVGITLTLSYSNKRPFSHFLLRGIKIFSWGLLITIATLLFLERGFVYFGVLHFIGVSIILAYPFLRLRYFNIVIGLFILFAGLYVSGLTFDFPWLLWIGLRPENFYSLDYFPVLPYFSLILFGIFLGNIFYKKHKRNFTIKERNIEFIEFLGRNSLAIYLLHQPLIILFISLFKNFF